MQNKFTLFKKENIILSIILIISFLTRLYRINTPLADWHSWRQADTSAVTRRFVQEGIDLLHPRYDDLSSIPSGLENPKGWRFVEFPIINALTALLFLTFRSINLEIWGRLTSIIFSLGSVLLIYKIVESFSGKRTGYIASLVYALIPYNLFYNRTILPEVPLVFFTLLAFHFFYKWINESKFTYLFISACSFSLGMLIKPIALFMFIPMLYLTIKKLKFNFLKNKNLYIFLFLSLAPFIFWRIWITQFPEGIPAYEWLLNGSKIRFRPAFFRWIFAERIGKLILGYWGLIPFALGIILKPSKKSGWVFHWWLLTAFLYLSVFATGNVTHDYYQIFIIPIISIFVAFGIDFMFKLQGNFINFKIFKVLIIISVVFGFSFAWFHIRDFYNINHPEIVTAGQAADIILPQDAKVIAPYLGDTAFLYQINRPGWPIGGDIQNKIKMGATDYVSVNMDDETIWLQENCNPAITMEQFTIISLRNCSL